MLKVIRTKKKIVYLMAYLELAPFLKNGIIVLLVSILEILNYKIFFSFLFFQIRALLPYQDNYNRLKRQFELKSYDLDLFKSRVEQNEHHKVISPSF